MQELSALVKNAKVITLDLTNATWEGMAIPANFANGATLLKEVKLPKVNGIGANAFNGCTGLENINEMLNNVSGSIGNSAFEECTNEKFNTLIIPNTISELGNRAFAYDIQLTKVTVPSSYYQETTDRIIPICENDAFYGINANGCEVEFTGEDDSNNYQEYRKQEGWMYLLTKDLDEAATYKNVNQAHADAKHTHTFKAGAWYSIVLPFAVNAKTISSVKTSNGEQAFDRAARYKYDDFSGKYVDEEKQMKKKYIKPTIAVLYMTPEMMLAGSTDYAITTKEGSSGQTPPPGGDTNVEYAKRHHFSAWDTWD